MRALTTHESRIVAAEAGGHTATMRVSIQDAGGTFRDLGSYPGEDMVKSVRWEEDIDSPGLTATILLHRAVGNLSLSPFHSTSPLNRAFVASNPAAALLAVGREVKLELAIAPVGGGGASFIEVFRGYVDRLSFPKAEVELSCVGLEGPLRDTWIEKERVYSFAQGSGAGKSVRVFELDTFYPLGERVVPTTERLNGYWYEVTTAGTTASTEPVWPTGAAATVTSLSCTFTRRDATDPAAGTAVETVLQALLDDNLGAGVVTLYTPTSPSWAVRWFKQQRQSVLDALRALAEQIGWLLRYRWHAGTSAWRLTLYDPVRTKTTPDVELSPDQVRGVETCEVALTDIRNVVRVVYSDSAGGGVRKALELTDSASVATYGRRFCEVAEGAASNIDTGTEAGRLASAILSDLAEPTATYAVDLQAYPWVELADLVRFLPDNLHSTGNLDLAVVAAAHEASAERSSTRITCRGKPSGGWDKWLQRVGEARPSDVHGLILFERPVPAGAAAVIVGGGEVTVGGGAGGRLPLPESVEVHLSKTDGFTPSSATLAGDGRASRFAIGSLEPGETYFYRTRPYAWNASRKVLGGFSAQGSFVAGRARAGHLDSQVVVGIGPPNGNFQHALRPLTTKPPDHWDLIAGTWGEGGDAFHGSDVTNGRFVMLAQTATSAQVRGGAWPIPRGTTRATLVAAVRPQGTLSAGRNLHFTVGFFSDEALTTSTGEADLEAPYNVAAANVWAEWQEQLDVPVGSNFARVTFYKAVASSAYGWDLGAVQLIPSAPSATEAWTALPYSSPWRNYGSGWASGAYCRDSAGRVHLRGLVQRPSGTNVTICVLPLTHRPSANLLFVAMSNGGLARVDVLPNGDVNAAAGGGFDNYLSLNGISFDTR